MKFPKIVLPGLGLLFLGYLIGHLGPDEILRNFAVLKWAFPSILLLACTWHITNTIAWSFAFPPGAFRPRLTTLFMAKLAGEAVNQLTPLANIGGEPLKAYLLRGQAPASRGLASVVINKTAQIFTGLIFTTLGLGLVFLYWDLPLSIPLPIQLGLGGLLLAGALLVGLFYKKQRRMFSALVNLLGKLGLRSQTLSEKMGQAVAIDSAIGQFYHLHKFRFALVMLLHSIGWLLGACETLVILRALGADIDFPVAFLITSLTLLINSLFFFMPSNIGVLEGGQVFLLVTLGLNPAMGLSLGIAKRMRKICWISLGWLFLTHLSRKSAALYGGQTGETAPSVPNLIKYR
ncbi:MAG: flippase-like domain-containing protein [Candidatus Latescibacteria bacterium]|nr:flippase-like domain-containing protein [Candidatus Latescibacterota bacterium]